MERTLIQGALLIDGTGRAPLADGAVLAEGETITFVGPQTEAIGLCPHPDRVIDAGGLALLPGLIDAHVHLASAWEAPERQRLGDEPEYLALWAAGTAQEVLRVGITTIGDCGAPDGITLAIRDAIARGHLMGPRVAACGPAITTTAGHGDYIGIGAAANNADELRTVVRKWIRRGVDFIKIMATGGSTDPASNRRRAQYSVEELRPAVTDAHRLAKRVVVHATATEGIRSSVAAGVDVLAHCNWFGVEEGTIEFDEEVAHQIADQGIMVDLNVGGALASFSTSSGRVLGWRGLCQPQRRWDLMLRLRELGVRVYLTSDGLARKIATYPEQICRMVEEADASPLEVLRMATQLPAQGLGLGQRLGTIEPGKVADVIAVEGDPSRDIRALTRVKLVVRSGRVVVSDGRLAQPTQALEAA